MEYLGIAAVLLMLWGVGWMFWVGRSGPRTLNALAETAVIVALPIGPFLWMALRRRHRNDGEPPRDS